MLLQSPKGSLCNNHAVPNGLKGPAMPGLPSQACIFRTNVITDFGNAITDYGNLISPVGNV